MKGPRSVWRKALISAFIVFHWGCVLAWLWPNPSDVKSFLMGLSAPLPIFKGTPSQPRVDLERRRIVETWLFHTGQHQDWAMFAPNPLQINRYVAATVTFRDGRQEEFTMPRLSQLGVIDCWIEKRYRKYQHRIAEERAPAFREDLARFVARRFATAGNPPLRVAIFEYQSPIPRHDRVKLPGWIDYTSLLRDNAVFSRKPLLDYVVRPGDLP